MTAENKVTSIYLGIFISVNVFGLVKCKLLEHRAQNVETVRPSYTDNNVYRARK